MKSSTSGIFSWFGVFTSLIIIVGCVGSLFANLYVPLFIQGFSFLDAFLALLFFVAVALSLWSFYCVSTILPGPPPSWLREEIVEAFVYDVLRGILSHGAEDEVKENVSHKVGGHRVGDSAQREYSEHGMSRGLGLAHEQKPNGKGKEHHGNQHTKKALGTFDTLQWMPQCSLPLAAAESLEAMQRSRESFVQEMSFLLGGARYCRFCRIYKLDDTHHCSTCRTCVHGMDHHCPWVGQCVGRENHKAFFLFLAYLVIASGVAILHTLIALAGQRVSFTEKDKATLFFFVFIIVTVIFMVLTLFFGFTVWMLLLGESTLLSMHRNAFDSYPARDLPLPRDSRSSDFSLLLDTNDNGAAVGGCRLANLRRVFGVGPMIPNGLLPLRPQWPPVAVEEETFWALQSARVEQCLRSLAEEEVHDGAAAEGTRNNWECVVPIRS